MTKYGKCLLMWSVFLIFLVVLPGSLRAQPVEGGADDPDAPIDGGVSLLLAAGIGYGIKKAIDNQKKWATHHYNDI